MNKKPPNRGTRVAPFLIAMGMLVLASVISFLQPSCIVTMARDSDGRITCEVKQRMLFLLPIGETRLRDVQEAKIHRGSRSDATIALKTPSGTTHLPSTFFLREQAIQELLANPSHPALTFRTAPNLVFVAPFAGLGLLILAIAIACEYQRLMQLSKTDG